MAFDLDSAVRALTDKKATKPCHRCGGEKFTVIDRSFLPIQPDSNVVKIPGPGIPVVLVGCDNCGAITQHALSVLGLTPKGEEVANGPRK